MGEPLAQRLRNTTHQHGLWGLTFGNGGNGGSTTSLYLSVGLNDDADGLFARIDVPESGLALLAGIGALAVRLRRIE